MTFASFCLFGASLMSLNSPMALPPFTFVGRLTDYAHVAYDADQVAEVRAYAEDGSLLAKAKTYYAKDSYYNFRLDIPMASAAMPGRVVAGAKIRLEFVDAAGDARDGIAVNDDAVVGKPGGCRRLTMMLATDENRDGISDEYVDYLGFFLWMRGLSPDDFDPDADYDGDGQSNRDEYIAGTDMFDPTDVFNLKTLDVDFWPKNDQGKTETEWVKVAFFASNGRAYTLLTSRSLDDGETWRLGRFHYNIDDGMPYSRLVTGGTETGLRWFYLPKDVARRFWRIEVE